MEIIKLNPQGFCGGVKYALNLLNKALADKSTPRPIYLMGNIIHNKTVMNEYKEKGVIILNECYNEDRFKIINNINEGTIIFSAHGTDSRLINLACDRGLNVIDTVCPNVKIVHNRIIEYLSKGYEIIYIGTKNHPECEGAMSISDKINLVSKIDDICTLNLNSNKIYVTNQTTLSLYDLEDFFNKILAKYPNSIIDNKICTATTERQKAVMNQKNVDLCIIVGDKLSSNSNKLYKISSVLGIKTIFCEGIDDINKNELKGVKRVSITSGASTPNYLVDEIIDYLKTVD